WWPASTPEGLDPVFALPLWLRTSCRGNLLWAYNAPHLDFLERWVGATLRHRAPNANRSLASRLPRWMTAANARDDVLGCLRALRATLAG
ncbi:MAG TPA: hypothetical protein VFQ39_01275, partial [Longimicrobium sp.]|nr:hypothetical protein [Longimicrobium sp.]